MLLKNHYKRKGEDLMKRGYGQVGEIAEVVTQIIKMIAGIFA